MTNQTNRWLIATDLDGTLFDHSLRISDRVREAMAAAQAAGHAVTLATGRMYQATLPMAEALQIDQPLICYQGALVRQGERVIHHLTLPLEVAHDVVRYCNAQGIHVNVYTDDRLFVKEHTPESAFYTTLSTNIPVEPVGDLLAFMTEEPTKLALITSEAEASQLLTMAETRWGLNAQVVRSHARFVELTHPAASKGAALVELAEALDIPLERTLAVGDNLNDLSMIRAAGVGVAMGNAMPQLKKEAAWVAPPVWADGLAAAIERFVLGAGSAP